jgi:endonuclease/exonuclease/phosphatase family metal-dependent hydrolase
MHGRLIAIFSAVILTGFPQPGHAAESTFTVMSRNIYIGTDVTVAMKKIPNLPAAAQFMWDQVTKTDFSKRALILAKEINDANADVIGLQEATTWYCKESIFSKKVKVLDFTDQLLKALNNEYMIAQKGNASAYNPGFSISPIPFLTKVNDAKTFNPIFDQNSAACGFETGDALLIKRSLASQVEAVGNVDYRATYSIVPVLMKITRGYTWADININGTKTRFVTTHLEAIWNENKVPNSALQANQLIADLKNITYPLVVIGDFNSDPRDPRPENSLNPGEQPPASVFCPANSEICNAYKLMLNANFTNASPDATDPNNFSWGMNAHLTGPDPLRAAAAKQMGNSNGFTDRLDYIFIKNGLHSKTSKIIGTKAPYGSDHAGVVVKIN